MVDTRGTPTPADAMAEAVTELLATLDADQYAAATTRFDDPEHRAWRYLPGPRPGLVFGEMTAEQRQLTLALLDHGCSEEGARTARAIVYLDRIRRELAGATVEPDDDRFWLRVLGTPGGEEPWAWRINGHHLAVHVTVVGSDYRVTPNFFGSEPAVVLHGVHEGLRVLSGEEDLARALLAELDPGQRRTAITTDLAPDDILTRTDPVVDPSMLPTGLAYAAMTTDQRDLLMRLVRHYFDRAPAERADRCWREAVAAGLEGVRFAWAGSTERGRGNGHYYAVTGPTFLLEYDNTQDEANHIHSVWRDLTGDWGQDLLSAHYAAAHHD